MHNFLSELANATCSLNFGHLIHGDGARPRTDTGRSLSRDATVRRIVATVLATEKTLSRRLKVVPIKGHGSEADASLDSRAVLRLMPERLCK